MHDHPLARLVAGLSAGALALSLAACGGSDPESSSSTPASSSPTPASSSPTPASSSSAPTDTTSTSTEVTADESDFAIELSSSTLPAGTYTFVVQNTGSATHSLEIEGPGLDDTVSDTVQGGESTTMTVTLQPGEYEVYCPIGNHRAMGMETSLTVS